MISSGEPLNGKLLSLLVEINPESVVAAVALSGNLKLTLNQ